jgi:hypothetical protein
MSRPADPRRAHRPADRELSTSGRHLLDPVSQRITTHTTPMTSIAGRTSSIAMAGVLLQWADVMEERKMVLSREERGRASSPLCLRLLPGTSLSLPAFDPVLANDRLGSTRRRLFQRYLPIRITSSHLPLTPARISDPSPCLPSARSSACTPTARATASLSGASSMVCLRYVVGTASPRSRLSTAHPRSQCAEADAPS